MDLIDLKQLFIPEAPILEIIIRGSVMYLGLVVILRHVAKRQGTNITDLLVIVMIADAAQNAMAADYHSIGDGILLVLTIIFWDYVLDYLSYHFTIVKKFLHSPPVILIENGKIVEANMKKELMRDDEVLSQLREQGIENISSVKAACLEADGKISVITKN